MKRKLIFRVFTDFIIQIGNKLIAFRQIYVLFLEKGWNFWILYKGKGFQIPKYQNHTKTSLFPWFKKSLQYCKVISFQLIKINEKKKSLILSEQIEMTTVRWIVFWSMVFSQSNWNKINQMTIPLIVQSSAIFQSKKMISTWTIQACHNTDSCLYIVVTTSEYSSAWFSCSI